MAIQFSTVYKGITLSSAYARIINYNGAKTKISLFIAIYSNKTESDSDPNGVNPLYFDNCDIPLKTPGCSYTQMYEYLMTQDAYKDGVAV